MWQRKKTDKKEDKWEVLKELSEKSQTAEDEKTLLLSKEDAEGTRMMWTGAARQYTLHLTDIKNPGRTFKASIGEGVVIGRKAGEADIVIDYEKSVSARHCRIFERNGKFYAKDLQSSNGSLLNGIRLEEETEICSGNLLTLGRLELKIQIR